MSTESDLPSWITDEKLREGVLRTVTDIATARACSVEDAMTALRVAVESDRAAMDRGAERERAAILRDGHMHASNLDDAGRTDEADALSGWLETIAEGQHRD